MTRIVATVVVRHRLNNLLLSELALGMVLNEMPPVGLVPDDGTFL